jgi:polyisoprenoid-binding protein YceI
MISRALFALLGIVLLVTVLGACAADTPTSAPSPTAPPATLVPPAALAHPLPRTLKDVTATQVYRFRVDPTQTTVEYAVREVLLGTDQITRGRTNNAEGEFQLYMQNGKVYVALSNLQVDLRTLTTDNAVRDQAIRKNWLESDKYPRAIFVASTVEGLPAEAVQNQPYTFKVSGDMTIHNTTKNVTFEITATIQENAILGQGTTTLYMRDFGFEPPSIVGKTIVSDPVNISVKGVAYLVQD